MVTNAVSGDKLQENITNTTKQHAIGADTFFFRYIYIIILLLNFNKFQNVMKMLSERAYIGYSF